MKKPTYRSREWHRRRALNEQKRRRSKAFGAHLRDSAFSLRTLKTFTSAEGTRLVRIESGDELPEVLSFRAAPDDTLAFFSNLRSRTLRGARTLVRHVEGGRVSRVGWVRAYSDFTTLRSISPSASLVLAAEYDRVGRTTGRPNVAVDLEKWHPEVIWTLRQVGFFDLLGIPEMAIPTPPVDLQNLLVARMQWGDDVNFGEAADALIDLFAAVGGDEGARIRLLGAVLDAVENVRAHAYEYQPEHLRRLIPPFWWVSGSADRVAKRLTLSIYDQGSTIPVTLPNRWPALSGLFKSLFGSNPDPTSDEYDGQALQAAMEISRTSTGQPERGLGLAKIREAVADSQGGSLRVISRRGMYELRNGSDYWSVNKVALPGTLVDIEATF